MPTERAPLARSPDPRLGRFSRINRLIADAALRLGARAEELCDVHTDHFLRLVHGERSVVVCKTRSPVLPVVAQQLANNKYVGRALMAAAGLPVVEHALVEDLEDPRDRDLARRMLERYGRLVVKPNWGNRAVGLVPDVTSMDALERAFDHACEHDFDEEVLLERQRPGRHLRVAVIGGRYAAACLIDHVMLEGDGRSSIGALVERLNEDPRRGAYDLSPLTPLDQLEVDEGFEEYLRAQGLSLEAVLEPGRVLPVYTEEQETIDCTDGVPEETRRAALEACRVLGVDVGGVDLMVEDESLSLRGGETGCILEVNVLPALHLHALPTQGEPRPVFEQFVRYVLGL